MQKMPNQMCERCPLVKTCCNGCDMLKKKLDRIKRDKNWGLMND
jgi:hypothetical protein